jgi:hypothetical protein
MKFGGATGASIDGGKGGAITYGKDECEDLFKSFFDDPTL